jgi:dTDP-4-dehydrorhamnose reductase
MTKLKGEEFVRALHPEFVIARTSVIYGWHHKKSNFATWVIDSLANRRRISVVDDQYNSPTLSNDLSEILRRMLLQGARGIYHIVGSDRVSRYDFALKIAEVFGLDGSFVKPAKMTDMNSWIARRPKDSSLRVDKLQKELDIQPFSLSESLKEMSQMRRLTG